MRIAGARQKQADFDGAARDFRAVHRNQDTAMPRRRRFARRSARVNHSERAFEPSRDQRQILAEATLRVAGIGNANNKEVVTFAGFIRDCFRPGRVLPGDNVDVLGLLLARIRFERGRRCGGAFDRLFGMLPIRLCRR